MPGQSTAVRCTVALLSALISVSALAGKGKITALPVMDEDFACTSPEAANRYQRDFAINVRSFGGNELCQASVETKKLYNDLQIVEEGRFAGSESNVFIQNFIDRDRYYPWLASMTYGVRRGHDVPYATAYNSGGYFTMQDGWAKLSTLGRVGTIIHEARHTQGYGHRQCTRGPYSDSYVRGCDRSVPEGGSHGVEMEYYSRVVLQGTNFHPAYQAMARLMALGRSNFVFNDLPMGSQDHLVALTQDKALLLDDTTAIEAQIPEHQGYELKRSSFGASLFDGSEAIAVDFYGQGGEAFPLADDFSYFKIIRMPQHVPAIDMEEFDVADKRYLISLDNQAQVRSFVFQSAEWSRPQTIAGAVRLVTVAPNGAQGLFVVKEDGRLCRLNPTNLRCTSVAKGLWPQDVVTYTYQGKDLIQLKTNGQVINVSTGRPLDLLTGTLVEQMTSVPVFDSFEL